MTHKDPKAALRTEAAARRALAFEANPLAGQTLSAVLPREALPPPGAVVSGYVPFRTEIDPRPLMERMAGRGARLALPVTRPKGHDGPLVFRLWEPHHALRPGHFRVHEPHDDAEAVEPDLLLVPLLAFDRAFHRLGYGAGHFDRTLAELRARKSVVAIGLAYSVQEIDELPRQAHDQVLDAVLTERAYVAARSGQSTMRSGGNADR
jgi:5-formyltetrahydrofolate cyclo-ligase